MSNDLRLALDLVARRFRQLRLWSTLALGWALCAIVGLGMVLWLANAATIPLSPVGLFALLALPAVATLAIGAAFAYRSARDRRWVARRIEAAYPRLAGGGVLFRFPRLFLVAVK